ncbi:MAG: PDZ domain-containing protein [Woeseiaceae bacterium]|nr:PDZ domain-containing protein [Woeseiaceae bacterium]
MKKTLVVILISAVGGFAIAAFVLDEPPAPSGAEPGPAITAFDSSGDVEARLEALEMAVSAEREARQLLEDELLAMYELLDSEESAAPDDEVAGVGRFEARPDDPRRASFSDRRGDPSRRMSSLTEAGFSEARAEWILQRESALRMEAMQARYEAMRSGEPPDPADRSMRPEQLLRDELGDAEYAMYLEANNRPTAVNIRSVLNASPAQSAGLQPGDEITHYDGERVFSVFDLTQQTMQGEPGQNVVVDIVRDGVPMQVVLPRGPVGISTRRGR